MEQLHDIIQRVPAIERQTLLCECFVFPRVEELRDTPCMTYITDILDMEEVKKYVLKHPTLIALNMRKDLIAVLDAIDEVKNTLWLEAYDFIQITRAGIELLRIQIVHPESRGRKATLELNEYRLRLQRIDPYPVTTRLVTIGMSVVATYAVAFLLNRLFR